MAECHSLPNALNSGCLMAGPGSLPRRRVERPHTHTCTRTRMWYTGARRRRRCNPLLRWWLPPPPLDTHLRANIHLLAAPSSALPLHHTLGRRKAVSEMACVNSCAPSQRGIPAIPLGERVAIDRHGISSFRYEPAVCAYRGPHAKWSKAALPRRAAPPPWHSYTYVHGRAVGGGLDSTTRGI